jgi:hypothetical protein
MLLLKLSNTQSQIFDEAPEAGMGLHFAHVEGDLGFVLSGRVLLLFDTKRREGREQSDALANRLWFGPKAPRSRQETIAPGSFEVTEEQIEEEESLIQALHKAPEEVTHLGPPGPSVLGFILNPIRYLLPAPQRPLYVYGHLPFSGVTQAGDVFYRCEHWASSRRIRRGTNDIAAGTYGFPASELDFVPTGFAAVGRYALPDLPPACRRYEITPPSGYTLQCGACVPLYGQAGGGVEVMFPKVFKNVVSIPPPTLLPPL